MFYLRCFRFQVRFYGELFSFFRLGDTIVHG